MDKDALREDALDDYIKYSCPDVAELTEHTCEPRSWRCGYCGWNGMPERTHNSGGVSNFRFCPDCKNSIYLVEIK